MPVGRERVPAHGVGAASAACRTGATTSSPSRRARCRRSCGPSSSSTCDRRAARRPGRSGAGPPSATRSSRCWKPGDVAAQRRVRPGRRRHAERARASHDEHEPSHRCGAPASGERWPKTGATSRSQKSITASAITNDREAGPERRRPRPEDEPEREERADDERPAEQVVQERRAREEPGVLLVDEERHARDGERDRRREPPPAAVQLARARARARPRPSPSAPAPTRRGRPCGSPSWCRRSSPATSGRRGRTRAPASR